MMRLVARFVAFMIVSAAPIGPASAQGREARPLRVLVERECRSRYPAGSITVVATPDDPCPGASLLRACGRPVRDDLCPTVAEAAVLLGDVGLDHCPASSVLAAAAGIRPVVEAERLLARRLYLIAARAPGLRGIALLGAGVLSVRSSRYADATRYFAAMLDEVSDPDLRAAALASYARVIAYDDHDEDIVVDEDFPVARFREPWIPERPWAHAVSLAAVRTLVADERWADAQAALDVIRRRWSDAAEDVAALERALSVRPQGRAWGECEDRVVERRLRATPLASCAVHGTRPVALRVHIATDVRVRLIGSAQVTRSAECVARLVAASSLASSLGSDVSMEVDVLVLFAPTQILGESAAPL